MNLDDFLDDEPESKPTKVANNPSDGIMLIDLSQITMATINATFDPKETLTPALVKHVVFNVIRSYVKKYRNKYQEIILCTDNPQPGGYWRKDIASYYKGTRAKGREESEWDFEVIFDTLNQIKMDLREFFPYKTIIVPRIEADDAIGVLVEKLAKYNRPILIVSSDGDFTQLQKFKNVKQFSPAVGKLIGPKNGSPYIDMMIKIIKGDRKDCVAAITMPNDHWLTHVAGGKRTPPMSKKKLEAIIDNPKEALSEEQYKRFEENTNLIDLSKVPEEYKDKIWDDYTSQVPVGRNHMFKYFMRNKMKALIEAINDF